MSREEIIGDATLYLGDCRELLPSLSADALVTDPPYGVELGSSDRRGGRHGLAKAAYPNSDDTLATFLSVVVPAIKLALEITKRGAVFCTKNLHYLPKSDALGGVYLPSAVGMHCWGRASFSPVLFYGIAPDLNFGPRASAISSVEAAEPNGHPCPKPLGWMRWLVGHASRIDERILDPFMGSGTTGVAALRLGRKFIGVEIEERWFDIACRRIEAEARQGRLPIDEPAPVAKPADLFAEVAAQ